MICVILLLIILILIFLWIYRTAFFSNPHGRKEDIHAIPSGEQYLHQRDRMHSLIDDLDRIPFEPVEIRSFDGLLLRARYYHKSDSAPVEIEFHGYRGSAIRDFCGGARIGLRKGHNILLVDQRTQGRSEGRTITFGIRERFDVLSWIDYVRKRLGEDVPIILAGVSMGAATVIMATGLDLPENVCGVVADCPYSSPEAIIQVVCGKMRLPVRLAMPMVRLVARVCGFSLRAASAVEAVKNGRTPVLIIHGEDDRFVPCDMSREIAAAGKRVQLETFPGAGHGLSYMVDTQRYEHCVEMFVDECLKNQMR